MNKVANIVKTLYFWSYILCVRIEVVLIDATGLHKVSKENINFVII